MIRELYTSKKIGQVRVVETAAGRWTWAVRSGTYWRPPVGTYRTKQAALTAAVRVNGGAAHDVDGLRFVMATETGHATVIHDRVVRRAEA